MHELALIRAENQTLRQANEALSKRRRVKKQRVQHGGALSAQELQDLEDQRAANEQLLKESKKNSSRVKKAGGQVQCCRIYGKPDHNTRTYQGAVESANQTICDVIVIDN
jgi:hypothetical protein